MYISLLIFCVASQSPLEAQFLQIPSAARAYENLAFFTSFPHPAGSKEQMYVLSFLPSWSVMLLLMCTKNSKSTASTLTSNRKQCTCHSQEVQIQVCCKFWVRSKKSDQFFLREIFSDFLLMLRPYTIHGNAS